MKIYMRRIGIGISILGSVVLLIYSSVVWVQANGANTDLARPAHGIYEQDRVYSAGVVHAGYDDYFTTVWGNPRDMDDPNDLYLLHSVCGPTARRKFSFEEIAGGMWTGVTSSSGENRDLYLLNPGWNSSLDVGEDGQLKPIDAAKYHVLTFRMYSRADTGQIAGIWFTGGVIPSNSGSIGFTIDPGWNNYSLDLSTHEGWSGDITGLWFNLWTVSDGVELRLDWARLTEDGSSPTEPVPIAEIVAPSYVSGEDWATTVAGDPWDMDSVSDIDPNETQTLNYSASGGVLDIVNNDDGNDPCEGAWPHRPLGLNLHGRRIDTSKYRYFTYRYKVDDAPDQGDGGVSRVRWLDTGAWAAGRTDDISLYNDGWNTYKIDLATVDLEAETAAWQSFDYNALHIIAHESHDPWTSHLDWVKLTAENEAHGAYTVGWNLHNVTEVDKTTIYWDADRNPGGLIGGWEVTEPVPGTPEPPPGPLYTYVPLVTRNYGSGALEVEADHQFTVPTSGLTPGQRYYVVVRLEDGPHTVDWYSELPVRIVN